MAGMKFNADIDLKNIVKLRQEIDKLKKSLIEIASVPNSDAAVKALEKQLASALKKLEKYKDKYVQTQQARIDQEKAASEQIKKQQKEIDSLIKKYEALQKQIEKGTVRAPRSPKTYTDDQISVALKTQVRSIIEAREQLKVLRFAQANVTDQQERETGARTKLNIKIQENTRYLKLNSDAYTRQKMEIGNYEENIRRALDGTGQFNLSLSKMLGVIGGTAALKGLVTDMINVRGEFQKTSIAFETMLGSKEKADALMAQMVETAAKTPFDLQGVTSGAKQLLAYGTSADKVNETLVRLGNIASGLSIPLGELVYLYGTSMSQGRLFTQDVNQFMGRGIPLVAELSKELGKTESEIRKMVTEGKVGFPELQKVIENMTNEGGKFYNLMEMQSTTLSGQISNLGDAWDSMLNSIGEDTQGIASMTISAATSIIENYDKVGKIILSIAATYGTYKAALIAVELYERRAAAARLLHIKIIRAQAVAQAALNLVSKANPYVLLATAIVGVTTAMWALHDSTTTTEREMERISKRTEVYNKYLQDEKNHVNELISVLQNENSTKKERIEAFNELQTKYPQYFGKYKTEKELIDHLTESLKGYNEQLRIRQELMNVKNNNDDIKRYKELEKFLSLARKGKDQRTSVEESDFNFYLKKYDVRKRGIGVTVEEYIQEMLASLSATIGEGQEIIRKQEQTAWEVALDSMDKTTAEGHKKMLEGYKILLRESGKEWIKIEGSEAPVNADILTNRIKQLNDKILNVEWKNAETYRKEAKIAWEKAKKEVEDVKSGKATYKSEADYQKALKEKQDAESEAEKRYKNLGGVTGNELSKQEKEAEKRKKEQEKLNEDLLSLRRQNQQAEIDLMEEGTEKKLKQIDLDYQKELDAIKKQEKDLSERQGGKLTSEQSIEISARYINAENKREKDIADYYKNVLSKYQDYITKRLEIEKRFDADREKLQKSGASDAQLNELEYQRTETLNSIDKEFAMREDSFQTWVDDITKIGLEKLRELLVEAERELERSEFLNPNDKGLAVQRAKVVSLKNTINKKSKETDTSPDKRSRKEWQELYKMLSKVEDEFDKIGSTVGGTAGEILSAAGSITSSTLQMIDGITLLANSSATAMEGTAKAASSAIKTVEKASVILAIISAALQIATKIASLFDDSEAQQRRFEEYQRRQEGYWQSINYQTERYLKLLKEAAGNDYFATATQSLTTLEKAREKAYKDIVKSMPVGDVDAVTFGLAQLFKSGKFAGKMTEYAFGGPQAKEIFDFIQANGGYDLENKLISEEAIWAMKSNADIWSKLPEWLQQAIDKFVEFNDKSKELEENLNKDLFQTTSQSLEEAILEGLKGGKRGIADFGEDFEEIMRNALLQSFVIDQLRGKAQEFYKKYTLLADSDENGKLDLTAEEISDLRKDWNDIIRAATEEAKNIDAIVGGSSSSSQEASKKGFATASQDSIDELNGRFTALQIAGEEIKNQNQLQTMSILELRADMLPIIANTTGIKDIASETRDLLRLSYEELTGIHDDTTSMNKSLKNIETDIAEVKRNTNGLSKR